MLDYRIMKLEDLVAYINNELAKNRNFTEIANNDFECNESTLRKKITAKKLYKRIGNTYVRQGQTTSDENKNSNMRQSHTIDDKSLNNNGRQDGRHYVSQEIISQTESYNGIQSELDNPKYLTLIDNYEVLMQMVEDYKKSKDHSSYLNGLVVELPQERKKDFRVTLRLNDVVYESFKEFADKNKQFTVKELVSQALKEFIEKYN